MPRTPLVPRAGWGAAPPRSVSHNIRPTGITGHYEAGPLRVGIAPQRFPTIVRGHQQYHFSQGMDDNAYTSAVDPYGIRYDIRGPGVRTGANGSSQGNFTSYAVVYLAGDGDPLTDAAKWAFLDEQERLGVPIRWPHNHWTSTSCPGSPLDRWIAQGCPAPASTEDVMDPRHLEAIAHAVDARHEVTRKYLEDRIKEVQTNVISFVQAAHDVSRADVRNALEEAA